MSAAKIYSVLADGVVIFQLLLKIPLPDLQITTKLQVFKHFYQLCSLLGKAPSTDSIEAKSLPTLRRILYSHKNGYNCRQIFVIFGQKQFHSTRPIWEGWRTEGWVWGVAPPTPLLTPNPDGETSRNCQSRELVIKIWSIQMKQENPVKANNQIAEFFCQNTL